MEILTQLNEWLRELSRTDDVTDTFVHWKSRELIAQDFVLYLYTRTNRYCIVAKPSSTEGKTYLGCTVSSRKPRAGEDWTRGNDLPDGKFNEETWNKIKNAIISYELVKIAKKERSEEEFDVAEENSPSQRRGSKPETRPLY